MHFKYAYDDVILDMRVCETLNTPDVVSANSYIATFPNSFIGHVPVAVSNDIVSPDDATKLIVGNVPALVRSMRTMNLRAPFGFFDGRTS